jgi:hypothetical protein
MLRWLLGSIPQTKDYRAPPVALPGRENGVWAGGLRKTLAISFGLAFLRKCPSFHFTFSKIPVTCYLLPVFSKTTFDL